MSRLMTRSIAIVVLVACVLLGVGTALGQLVDTGSPARGHASVVAQSVAALGEGDLGWRVTRASTPQQSAQTPRDDPGFLLVDAGTLLVTDADTNAQTRLAASEAMFLGVGTRHGEAPASAAALSFYRLDLVGASEVATAGNDELLFIGEPFASPGGNRDLDLVRDVLADGESVLLELQGQAAPVLLLVTAGTLDLVPAGNEGAAPVPLPAGQGAALGGDVIATARGGAGATFVTAFVGPVAEPFLAQEAEPTATPLPEPATLAVQILACPAGYEGADFAVDCVEPVADVTLDLSSATGVTAQGTTGGDGTVTFVDLIPDTYSLSGGVPGEFAEQFVACSVPSEGSQTLVQGATFAVAGGEAVTCQWYVVPVDVQGDGVGSIAVTAYLCPGTPLDPAADCAPIDISGAAVAGPEGMPSDLAEGIPFGSYALLTDGIAVPVGYELSEVRGSAGASDSGWAFAVDESNPDAVLQVIYVPAGQPGGDTDEDTDGLTGAQEAEFGTDPANPDTDGDGLFDGPEVAAGTDPTLYDTDGDGFGDNQEAVSGSNPLDPASVPEGESGIDTDGDLLSDAQEAELGTNPAAADSDGDGLTDFAEAGFEPGSATGTNPLVFDTDGDGVGDGDEVANGTDPLDPASF